MILRVAVAVGVSVEGGVGVSVGLDVEVNVGEWVGVSVTSPIVAELVGVGV